MSAVPKPDMESADRLALYIMVRLTCPHDPLHCDNLGFGMC